jgi:hypothetical protein
LSVKANAGFDAFHTWIIKNNRLDLAESIRGILPFPISDILKDKIHRVFSWVLSSWIKGISAILALVISILVGHYLISCEGCAQQRAKNKDISDELSDKEKSPLLQRIVPAKGSVDAGSVDAGLAGAIPHECSHLPAGPDRKDCLVNLADAMRGDFKRAEYIYRIAIADSYRTEGIGKRHIDRYWHFVLIWPDEVSGDKLLKAQNHNALLALTTLYARAGKFELAATTWQRAVDLAFKEDDGLGGGRTCAAYILAFLNRKANRQGNYTDMLQFRACYGQLAFETARVQADIGNFKSSIEYLTKAYSQIFEVAGPVSGPTEIGTDIYWAGILPTLEDIRRDL